MLLYTALIGYIHYEAPEEEQNFSTLLEMINAMEVREDDEEFKNAVDLMFDELKERDPGHFAVRQYAKYKLAASIKECMKTTPVARITVKDIVEGSGLTRQTFYRNFKDKYDLINWYFDKLVLQSFEQIGMGNTVGESLTQKFEFILNEKAFFTEAFRSDDYNSVKEHDFELILQFYKELIARKTSRIAAVLCT